MEHSKTYTKKIPTKSLLKMFEYLKTYKNPYKGFVVFNIDTCEPVDPRAERKYGLEDNEVLFSIDNNIGDWKIHLD